MDDQNKTTQSNNGKGPISSGIAPGPGEHYADELTQQATTGGQRDDYNATTGSNMRRGGNTGNGSSAQGAADEWHWPTSESMNAGRSWQGQGAMAGSSLLNRAQERVRGSKGVFLVGTIAAGFLLQRILQATPARATGSRSKGYATADQYGSDATLDDDRKYGLDTAYSPEPAYQSGMSTSGKSSQAMARIADKVRQAGDSARTRLSSTTSDARARWHDARHATKDQYYRARERVTTMTDERPLLIGALGIAAGAGLGAMLAVTRRENELMGDLRDKVMGKAKETASTQMENLKQSAQRFADFAKEEAQREKDRLMNAAGESMGKSGVGVGDKTR